MSIVRTKSPGVNDDIFFAMEHSPALYVVINSADAYCQYTFFKDICVTRVYPTTSGEPDPHSLHSSGRAADIRVWHPGRDGPAGREITLEEARKLVEWINDTFRYGRKWTGRLTYVAHLIEDGQNTHIHVQVKRREGWKPA